MGNKQQAGNTSRYLSPKDYVKPVYPSPAKQIAELSAKSQYATPAQQLAEMTLKQKQVHKQAELPAFLLPSKLHKQMKP